MTPVALLLVPQVTFTSLLHELGDRSSLSKWPSPEYQSLQATSYNRESVKRGQPGWFADSDGTGYIREEGQGADKRYVLMEHDGPGCITKMWTPFFYYDFNERTGPDIQIILDGKTVFDESLIKLVTGKGSVSPPWAAYSARAGNLYLPMPFARSAKVTMKQKPFYFSINYRVYPKGTTVEHFERGFLAKRSAEIKEAARLSGNFFQLPKIKSDTLIVAPGQARKLILPRGEQALRELKVSIEGAKSDPSLLRSTVLTAAFDKSQTVWCPLGDFFCSADSLHSFQTRTRSIDAAGRMWSGWWMPYQRSGEIAIENHGRKTIQVTVTKVVVPAKWTSRSMHFYARWRPDDIVPGTPFSDWNFVDIHGKGVYVGDAWTVANVRKDSWWGEGDEKVYIDEAWDKGFPTHFGTGSEDYYGWAGGVYPVLEDQFSSPFLANVKVGGLDGHTQGYNILTRVRGLDAIPFHRRLRFDMESSFGTDMREKWDLLGYSAVTFFYARPGAIHNRPAQPEAVSKPILSLAQIQATSDKIKADR
ncbi:MAG: DUF2961 domain-containing protein [Armatimonadetes bacterium]|nr:DUF2961 domain-containing protein [Armatimonadota bacterium]